VPTWSQYSATPLPVLQRNVTVEPVKVDPAAGSVIVALPEPMLCARENAAISAKAITAGKSDFEATPFATTLFSNPHRRLAKRDAENRTLTVPNSSAI
jgi:hypothetical protein